MKIGKSIFRAGQKGFTLVELLVVIGIIAILIAMLLPALNRARDQAATIQCMSNMRQLAMMMQQYAGDNQQFLPFGSWDSSDSDANAVNGRGTRQSQTWSQYVDASMPVTSQWNSTRLANPARLCTGIFDSQLPPGNAAAIAAGIVPNPANGPGSAYDQDSAEKPPFANALCPTVCSSISRSTINYLNANSCRS